jgi:hypothetical protein
LDYGWISRKYPSQEGIEGGYPWISMDILHPSMDWTGYTYIQTSSRMPQSSWIYPWIGWMDEFGTLTVITGTSVPMSSEGSRNTVGLIASCDVEFPKT